MVYFKDLTSVTSASPALSWPLKAYGVGEGIHSLFSFFFNLGLKESGSLNLGSLLQICKRKYIFLPKNVCS